MHPKPIYPRLIPPLRLDGHERGIDLEEDIGERGAEVGAVDAVVARRLGIVDVLAFGAVEFDGAGAGDVVLAGGEEVLGLADDAGAFAEDALFVFLHLRGIISTSGLRNRGNGILLPSSPDL